jgi:hypothetical protein
MAAECKMAVKLSLLAQSLKCIYFFSIFQKLIQASNPSNNENKEASII